MDQTPETELLAASKLVQAVASGELDFQQFVGRYDNFYYAAALDGHEGGAEYLKFLEENRALVALHEQIQTVLDRVYVSPFGQEPVAEPAGRLTVHEAAREIVTLVSESELNNEMRALDRKLHR